MGRGKIYHGFENPRVKIEGFDDQAQNPKPKTQNPKPKTQKIKTQDLKIKRKNTLNLMGFQNLKSWK